MDGKDIKRLLTKCKRIVTFFKCSTIAYEKFKSAQGAVKPYSLIQEVCTRWNSAYKMVERTLLTKEYINPVLLSLSKAPEPLTADEVAILEDLQDVLAPFDDVTKQLSSSTQVTVSSIIPISNGLVQNLDEKCDKLSTVEGNELCKLFIEKCEERSSTRLATILDTRFKMEGFRSQFNAEQAVNLLENTITSLPLANKDLNIIPEPPEPPKSSLLKFVKQNIELKSRTKRVESIIQLRQYFEKLNIDEGHDPLEYWKVSQ